MKRLTIGMMTYDDYDGVFFTLESLRLYHPEVLPQIEFLVVDNNPTSPYGQSCKKLCDSLPDANYCAVAGKSGTTLKNLIFEMSKTELTMCLDCHVLLAPGSLNKLLKFYEMVPECDDLLQGPLLGNNGDVIATEMQPNFRGSSFGTWHVDDRGVKADADAYEISMQGMGMFVCRTVAWPRFAAGTSGFGSEEGVIHEKFRVMGRKVYCMPFLRWLHRFDRPGGVPYPIDEISRLRNLVLGFREVQLPIEMAVQFYQNRLDGDPKKSQEIASDVLAWGNSLPPSPFPQRKTEPFLGQPIQILKDT